MTSNDIYTPFIPDQYCVYHTTYSGTLLPQNYIGSSSVDNVLTKNYHGSVGSERYKAIWKSELQLHPEIFSTVIVSYHDTRPNATWKELQIQRTLNVVKSDLFINRSYAIINGWCDTTYLPEERASSTKKRLDTNANKSPEEKAVTVQKTKETKIRNGTTNPTSPESIQRGLYTRQRNGTMNSNTPESIQKGKDTRKINGTTNPNTPESIQKGKDTRKINEITNSTPESIQKGIDTKIRNGTMNTQTPESIQKTKDTRKRNGTNNPATVPFLSMLHNKKTYNKSIISRVFPELKQYY